ncbi:hypothetical protein Poli38472_002496 [Pythium oligandrum]|uniref:Uncharacterized protein n=1 Tax=Pythium oligandrum TaxID=41045 RepID=A0A8K1FH62_PYTOL|nr:hypothetical protein Poli38472_002496 [Pythium oligandrum]|eukprot:TMW63555.1 hypothetical protein Poli38472_002496 [Pythium oligandrum]
MATPATKSYSLFQRSVRVVQTSIRSSNGWLLQHMPGIPDPPEVAERLKEPTFVDLWEYTLADHRRNLRDAWREYKQGFDEPDEIDIEKSKQAVRDAARRLRGNVEENTSKNKEFLEEKLQGTQVLANIKEIHSTASENVHFLKDEFAKAQEHVDPDAIMQNVKSVVDEHRSKKDVVSTLTGNVEEIVDLVKTGRDAALRLEKSDVDAIKGEAQSWFADKLMVAQDVLKAFIEGYREGKAMELEREDALLITFAKQAAEEQKDMLKEQFDKLVETQRAKQEQERREAEAKGSEPAPAQQTEDAQTDKTEQSEELKVESSRQ